MKAEVNTTEVTEEARRLTREEEAVGNVGLSKAILCLAFVDLLIFLFALLFYILSKVLQTEELEQVFTARGMNLVPYNMIPAFLGFVLKLVLYIYCRKVSGTRAFFKYAFIVLMLADCMILQSLGTGLSFLFLIPIIFSCFYFDYRFTRKTLIASLISYLISAIVSMLYAGIDISNVTAAQEVVIPEGMRVGDFFYSEQYVNMPDYYSSFVWGNLIPELLEILIVGLVCFEVAKRGQNMTIRQNRMVKKTTTIETELNLAAKIQLDMVPNVFPAFPDYRQFDIYAMMEPAKNVGGDFYDYYFVDEDHLAVVMADVCGKGVPAALFMSRARTCLQDHLSSTELSLTEAINRTNRMMMEHNPSMTFTTAWIGVLDIHTGEMSFVNAGHTKPILLDRNGNEKDFTYDRNIMIGAVKYKYQQDTIKLEPGDRLFLCTDGIYEAHIMNGDDDLGLNDDMMFGRERAVEVLRAGLGTGTQESVMMLRNAVGEFVNHQEQFDDITMLYLTYNGEA